MNDPQFRWILIAVSIFAWYIKITFIAQGSPIVATRQGKVQGKEAYSRDGRKYYEYLGIPYAKPPTQYLRFEDPQPANVWTDIKEVKTFRAECAQYNFPTGRILPEEDCLFLNVFTPMVDKQARLPVIVFIHGGIFMVGTSNYQGGKYFVDENVVLVTINYRLGALGFLNTGDGIIRGNMGLKDQVAALEWVQQNIEAFGGDPDKVTIMGESSGGAAVHYHMLSPLSKGLFRRGISQSGVAINHWAEQRYPQEQARHFAGLLNCPNHTTLDIVACLKELPIRDLLHGHLDTNSNYRDPLSLFGPTVEGDYPGAFLTKKPLELVKAGKSARVPWMTGYNTDEGQLFFALFARSTSERRILEENFNEKLPYIMFFAYLEKTEREALSKEIQNFYFNGTKPDGLKTVSIYNDLFTDLMFRFGVREAIRLQSQFQPVYPYFYNHHGDHQLADLIFSIKGNYPILVEGTIYMIKKWISEKFNQHYPVLKGASHGDQLTMYFDHPIFGLNPRNIEDNQISRHMVKLFADFARGESHIKFRGKPLPCVRKEEADVKFLKLDLFPEIVSEPKAEPIKFWRQKLSQI